jgi:hypothetical protein
MTDADTRPTPEELKAMRCPDCGGMLVTAARWSKGPWYPGKFCSCPFDEEHP